MKKIIFTIAALAALSTVSFAGENRSWDLRDSDTYFGKYSTQLKDNAASAVSSAALAVSGDTGTMTNFDRMMKLSIENNQGRH
ncbi:MAG: hypothetical protein Q8L53_10195 [Aestuariivirga sp.]|nr:hypothetical protein [Aestuariivirga sp.]